MMTGETTRFISSKTKEIIQSIVRIFTVVGIVHLILVSYFLIWWRWGSIAKSLICEHSLEWYQPFEALVTGGAAIVALATFIADIRKRNRERAQDRMHRERESKKLQMALFSQTLNSFMVELRSFTTSQDAVSLGEIKGVAAILKFLYYPFRERERTALESNDKDALEKINVEFMSMVNRLNIEPMAQHLWALFNWILYQQLLCGTFAYSENDNEADETSVREAFLRILDSPTILTPQMRWVFGKYRHLYYGLDTDKVSSLSYRGIDYSDRVLLYRPTLELLPNSKKKEDLINRSKKMENMELATLQKGTL